MTVCECSVINIDKNACLVVEGGRRERERERERERALGSSMCVFVHGRMFVFYTYNTCTATVDGR